MINLPFLSVVPIHPDLPDEEYNRTLANFKGSFWSSTPPVIESPPIVACRNSGSGQRGAATHKDVAKITVSADHRISSLYHRRASSQESRSTTLTPSHDANSARSKEQDRNVDVSILLMINLPFLSVVPIHPDLP